jgi:hypothetical protein
LPWISFDGITISWFLEENSCSMLYYCCPFLF